MARLVAFLRGINLGKRRVKMDDLRRHFEAMGLEDVATFIASGNVVFDAPADEAHDALEGRLERHLEEGLGFFTDTLVRPLDEVGALTRLPLVVDAEADGFTPYVIFAKSRPTDVEAFEELHTPDDRFVVRTREVFWLRRGGLSDSTVKTHHLQSAFGSIANTTRKIDTLRRLMDKFGS